MIKDREYEKLKKEIGQVPRFFELSSSIKRRIRLRYESYYDFLEEVGDLKEYKKLYKFHTSSRKISRSQLITEIQEIYSKNGYPPRSSEYKRSATALNKFGSWDNFLAVAKIAKPTLANGVRYISKEELINKAKKITKKYGRFPTWRELKKEHFPVAEIKAYFGSISNLAKAIKVQSKWDKGRQEAKEFLDKCYQLALEKNKEGKRIDTTIAEELGHDVNYLTKMLERYQRMDHQLKSKSLYSYLKLRGLSVNNVVILNHRFKTWKEAEKFFNINQNILRTRVKRFGPNNKEKILHNKYRVILVGKEYKSLAEAAKLHNINIGTLTKRIQYFGKDDPRIFSKNYIYDPKMKRESVVICGTKYASLTEAAKKNHVSYRTLKMRILKYGYDNPHLLKDTQK